MSDSLIKRDEEQMALFDSERDRGEIFALTSKGNYTGERLFKDRPEVYRAVLILSAKGCGPRQIIRQIKHHYQIGVDYYTIRAVQEAERDLIPTVKERLGRHNMLLAEGLGEIIAEGIIDGTLKVETWRDLNAATISLGILQQRGAELIDGGVVIKHEHEHRKFTTVDEMFETLPDNGPKVIDAEIIGFGASEASAKKALPGQGEHLDRSDETETSEVINRAARGDDSSSSS